MNLLKVTKNIKILENLLLVTEMSTQMVAYLVILLPPKNYKKIAIHLSK